ncbi:hypothetical protein [Flavobacterium succinicans]|uniref:Uncharacterized protein n=1 Tax=Flavobacterium succinicans TaxID=29536 RepID=A0A199XNV8_9FLAO|nr:hypothetical protein [Flavobacterium succinicans]OAZ03320.1 hypothetical protein FLB_21070 [Flavobacterium succinicans]
MNPSFFKKIIPLLLIIISAYGLHEGLFFALHENTSHFVYSLKELYAWFTLFTVLIVFVLLLVKRKSLDNVGMSFLLVTSVKMLFCYLLLRPILKVTTLQDSVEKINFFGLFIFFLLLETLFTIHLVNEKQK